jgi:hypothetical protein
MATWNKVNQFPEDLAHGVHDLSTDAITVALVAAANAPDALDATLADLTQIAYTFLSSRVITTTSSDQASGTYKLVLQDLTLTSTGGATGPFRYIALYNDSSVSNSLLGYYDYGSNLTLNDGESLTIDFSEVNGALTIA